MSLARHRIRVTGLVQGVGFRPFVFQRAVGLELAGWVRNDLRGVTIEVEGTQETIDRFLSGLAAAAPPLARIDSIDRFRCPTQREQGFRIVASDDHQDAVTWVAPDVSPCRECLREMDNPQDRRFRYPFINCTHCGPRFTIVEDLPYDRPLTTMRTFAMCRQCAAEYGDPLNRRYHAQPIGCPACGPQLSWAASGDSPLVEAIGVPITCEREEALQAARAILQQGGLLAVKGVGGFHVACDAQSEASVARLRECKHRDAKPLAVLVPDLATAHHLTVLDEAELHLLESPERPIVLVRKRHDGMKLADGIAPHSPYLGILRADSPLHDLLVRDGPPLAFTSGNLSEEPIVTDNRDALERLGPLVDGVLLHDREIAVPCDDSVVRSLSQGILPIRRARGYAPLPIRLPRRGCHVLAMGGDLKAACCVSRDQFAFVGQHIGDMENVETAEAMQVISRRLMRLFRVRPECIAADLHPDYHSFGAAEAWSNTLGVPLLRFQHHEAHLAALAAECGLHEETPLVGVCFDGTGWGTDGAIWGGEFFVVEGARATRVAHLRYCPLPGGDACARRPYRTALAYLWEAQLAWDERLPGVAACSPEERLLVRQQLKQGIHAPLSSSMGRLFDAMASLLGICQQVRYEAEAAMLLEHLAAGAMGADVPSYRFGWTEGEPSQIDPRPVIRDAVRDTLAGQAPAITAAAFHRAVAAMIVRQCATICAATGTPRVGLSGGVFQNVLLVEETMRGLQNAGLEVLVHRLVPPNDGGLSLGQAWLASQTVGG
jgi:hydrogenase maturation protein HypF